MTLQYVPAHMAVRVEQGVDRWFVSIGPDAVCPLPIVVCRGQRLTIQVSEDGQASAVLEWTAMLRQVVMP